MRHAEEEKLEPLRTATDDPKIRLLNRLYARKRKELQERKMLRDSVESEGKPVRAAASSDASRRGLTPRVRAVQGDARSVDELLNFIDGEGQREAAAAASAKAKPKKKKGKKRGGKGGAGDEQAGDAAEGDGAQAVASAAPSRVAGGASAQELFPEDGFDDDDGDLGSDIEPELLAKLDQEVEEFKSRLNAKWQPRPAPPQQASAQQSTSENVAAVRSLLTSCLQSLGLADHLQVRPCGAGSTTAPLC